MKILSWNCRGLGNSRAVHNLGKMVHRGKPDIIFLMEMRATLETMDKVRQKIRFRGSHVVERKGRGGGLALLWRHDGLCSIEDSSDNQIIAMVNDIGESKWKLTVFYGFSERVRRKDSWELLTSLQKRKEDAWLCTGDFNDLLYEAEKEGGDCQPRWLLNGFRNAIDNCGLIDVPLHGEQFTWERVENNVVTIRERLDRAMGNSKWLSLFVEARLEIVVAAYSDHSPLLLTTHET